MAHIQTFKWLSFYNLKLLVIYLFKALRGSSGGRIYFILISMIDDDEITDDVSLKENKNDFCFR